MKPIERVIILGNKGFIGGNLQRYFEAHSSVEIVGRDLPETDLTCAEQVDQLGDLFNQNTALIICAAIKKQLGDNLDTFVSNLKITTNLCRTLAKRPAGRVVFFSSAAVYGEDVHNTNITEATPPQPATYYGLSKYTSEILLRKAVGQTGSLLAVRPALIYGPGDQGGYGPTGFIKACLAGEPITLWGDGLERREFVYIGDVVKAVYALTFHSYDGVVNVVSGTSYTYIDIIQELRKLVCVVEPVKSRPRTKNKADHGFENSQLRRLVPDLTFTSLADGLRLTFNYARVPDRVRAP